MMMSFFAQPAVPAVPAVPRQGLEVVYASETFVISQGRAGRWLDLVVSPGETWGTVINHSY